MSAIFATSAVITAANTARAHNNVYGPRPRSERANSSTSNLSAAGTAHDSEADAISQLAPSEVAASVTAGETNPEASTATLAVPEHAYSGGRSDTSSPPPFIAATYQPRPPPPPPAIKNGRLVVPMGLLGFAGGLAVTIWAAVEPEKSLGPGEHFGGLSNASMRVKSLVGLYIFTPIILGFIGVCAGFALEKQINARARRQNDVELAVIR